MKTQSAVDLLDRHEKLLNQFNLTADDVRQYCRLKAEIFGKGGPFRALFVELDMNNADHVKYKELAAKMVHLHAHLLVHRND